MPLSFENKRKLVGLKQSRRAIKEGRVLEAYLASDAEERIALPFLDLCREENVPVSTASSMKELGQAAGIDIGAAVAVVLK